MNIYLKRTLQVGALAGAMTLGYILAKHDKGEPFFRSNRENKELVQGNNQINIDAGKKSHIDVNLYDVNVNATITDNSYKKGTQTPPPKVTGGSDPNKGGYNQGYKDGVQDQRLSELEKKIAEQKTEEVAPTPVQEEVYQPPVVESKRHKGRFLSRVLGRDECSMDSADDVLLRGTRFQNNQYGVLEYRGPTSGNRLEFYNMQSGMPVYMPRNMFYGMGWNVQIQGNGYYITFRNGGINTVQRWMNNEMMFQPGWISR